MRRSIALPLLITVLVATACRRDETKAGPPASDAAAVQATANDASARTTEPPKADGVDLLHYRGASVAVSSNVDNPRDFPEHLVDGLDDTAWNGKSGDLKGAWIAFRVPEGAHVTRIEMSAGFDKQNADGDLFTMNHRIARVRIKRGKTVLREHTFDTNERKPQTIPIDAAGGSYRIEITETLPGSKLAWKEACVSELRVIGRPDADAVISKTAPLVGIGSFANEPPRAAASIGAGFTPTADIRSVTRVRVFQENWSEERLVVETASGFFVPEGEPIDSANFNDPGCFGSTKVTVTSVRANGAGVEAIIGRRWKNRRYNYEADGGVEATSDSDDVSTHKVECAIAGSKMKCTPKLMSRVCHFDKSVVPCDSF